MHVVTSLFVKSRRLHFPVGIHVVVTASMMGSCTCICGSRFAVGKIFVIVLQVCWVVMLLSPQYPF